MYLPRKRSGMSPWIIVVLVIVCFFLIVRSLSGILTPFLVAAILAYILNPLVLRLTNKGLKRGVAAMLVMLICFLVVLLLFLIVVPMVVSQISALVDHIPSVMNYIQDKFIPWFNTRFGYSFSLDSHSIGTFLQDNASGLQSGVRKALASLMQRSGHMIGVLINICLLPFLLYYFLLDWHKWQASIFKMIPRKWVAKVSEVATELDSVLGEFLRGQLTVMLSMGLFYGIGLSIVGLNSGFAVGMVAGLIGFVPYLGAIVGIGLATLAALLQFDAFTSILLVWAVFAVGSTIEGYILTPRLVGERIGLSPLAVIFSLFAFGELMGFVGMLLALPLAAITLVLGRELLDVYYESSFYQTVRKRFTLAGSQKE